MSQSLKDVETKKKSLDHITEIEGDFSSEFDEYDSEEEKAKNKKTSHAVQTP